ncbi:MAG: aminotransferase class I/II-fold pyridoxal phosphate-dependent enzyme [Acidobacteria bacterium]|nr:aminotransferase class I/II-fold pyridoxal phosphate-dependent enzyme [Acidobacteriota bacterium]
MERLLNQQFDLLRPSATVAMADRILALKAAGRPIIGLQVGDPDFATPASVRETALRALEAGLTHYGPSQGTLDLRQAIAAKLLRDEGVGYDPATEILVTHGGIHAYHTALQAILNPGDEVLVPDPSWATHANMAVMLRGTVARVPAPAETGFLPALDAWAQAVTPRTRALVLNYPSNPTGAYPDPAYLEALQGLAEARGLWIVSDEVYGSLYYGERPGSAAAPPARRPARSW